MIGAKTYYVTRGYGYSNSFLFLTPYEPKELGRAPQSNDGNRWDDESFWYPIDPSTDDVDVNCVNHEATSVLCRHGMEKVLGVRLDPQQTMKLRITMS